MPHGWIKPFMWCLFIIYLIIYKKLVISHFFTLYLGINTKRKTGFLRVPTKDTGYNIIIRESLMQNLDSKGMIWYHKEVNNEAFATVTHF